MLKQEEKTVHYNPNLPEYKELLKAGVHFGHPTNKWNPSAKAFIYGQRNGIHIIDVNKTIDSLKVALDEIAKQSAKGPILFVGTKNQAKDIVEGVAIKNGAYFVTHRWVGGLLTNFKLVKKSLERLRKLESDFETGIEGRTKQEISWMKKDWDRLNRLYGGIKTMSEMPTMLIIIDPSFEKSAIKESKVLKIPTVGLVDTNTSPNIVTYPVYSNDDALSALELMVNLLGDAVSFGNKTHGIKHVFKDYTKFEVKKIQTVNDNQLPKVKKVRVRSGVTKVKPEKVEKESKVEDKVVVKEKNVKPTKEKKAVKKSSTKIVKKTTKKVIKKSKAK